MSSGQTDLQAAFRSLVHGEQCYHWRSIIRFSEESGKFHWEFPEFDLATAQRFLELPASSPEEYLRQEKRHANPEDWARCRKSIEQTLLKGGKGIQQEYRIRDTRGRQRITRDLLQFDRLSKGIWEVVGFCFDVTESRIRERFQAGQSKVLELIATGRPCAEALEQLCVLLQESLGDGFAGLGRYNAANNRLTSFVAPGMSDRHRNVLMRMRLGLPEAMKMTGQVVIVEDVRTDTDWKDYRFLYRASGCPTAWTHPVRDAQGKLSGFIAVCLTTPRAPTEAELQVLQSAAQIAGVALEREEIERRRAESEKTVMDVIRGVRCLLWQAQVRLLEGETYQFYDLKLPQQDIGLQFLGFEARDAIDLFNQIHAGVSSEDLTRMQANHITCFENGRAGYQNEFRCLDGRGRVRWLREDIRVEPVAKGQWQLVGVTTDVTAQRQAEEDVRWQALHDTLTGLPNRALLQQVLEDSLSVARSSRRHCGVLFLDLDRFKQVNDRLGHGIGDRLLCEVARRLQGAVRETDMVARISGDEFIVLLPEVVDEADARQVAERVRDALRKPCQLGPHELLIGGSIGVSLYPRDGKSAEVLLRNADMAMYRAKERRDGTVSFYSSEMDLGTDHLLQEMELRRALERQEFFLEYQPQIDTRQQNWLTLEALVRWRHPERGVVGPAEFIPLAEETGLITALGGWILRTACEQASQWQSQDLPLRVSVNLSARQFNTPALIPDIAAILKTVGLDPERLDLEITETTILQGGEKARGTLEGLRALGVRLMIDDFGTGYSSLSSLRCHPVDVVKIDRSFVMGMMESPEDAAIVRAVVELARALELGVIAEGVETDAHRRALEALGCTTMQGFHFSHPLPPEAIPELLTKTPNLPIKLAA